MILSFRDARAISGKSVTMSMRMGSLSVRNFETKSNSEHAIDV
jgi:hypothetical protein